MVYLPKHSTRLATMTRERLIKEIDDFVYEAELNGVPEQEILDALREYLEIVEELDHV